MSGSPLGARLSMSPALREISSSDAAMKSYSALATTWSSSPLAQLLAEIVKERKNIFPVFILPSEVVYPNEVFL